MIKYRHKRTGNEYILLHIANESAKDKSKWPTTAVYISVDTLEIFARPDDEFLEKFEEVLCD